MERWVPKTLAEYGDAPHVRKAVAYVKNPTKGEALLLSGPPGCGKTTLLHCIANDARADLVEVNASEHLTKDRCARIEEAMRTSGLEGRRIFFFDEADSLDRWSADRVAKLIANSNAPVFLAANEDVSAALKKVCTTVRVAPPSAASIDKLKQRTGLTSPLPVVTSYRDFWVLAEGATPLDGNVEEDEAVKLLLSGVDVDLRPSDHWRVAALLADNTTDDSPAQWGMWLERYRTVGRRMEKYLVHSAKGKAKAINSRWSLGIRKAS